MGKTLLGLLPRLDAVGAIWDERLRRWRRAAILAASAALVSVLALTFLVVALYSYLALVLPAWQAAAAIGGGAVALAALLVALAGAGSKRRRRARTRSSAGDMLGGARAFIDEALGKSDLRGTELVVASFVAGIMLGAGVERPREERGGEAG